MEEVLSHLFPWAEFETDEDAYLDHMRSIWSTECYMGYDKEDGEYIYTEPFETWLKPPSLSGSILPVSEDGETVGYRLLLSLNKIGLAFIEINEFLDEVDNVEGKLFTLES